MARGRRAQKDVCKRHTNSVVRAHALATGHVENPPLRSYPIVLPKGPRPQCHAARDRRCGSLAVFCEPPVTGRGGTHQVPVAHRPSSRSRVRRGDFGGRTQRAKVLSRAHWMSFVGIGSSSLSGCHAILPPRDEALRQWRRCGSTGYALVRCPSALQSQPYPVYGLVASLCTLLVDGSSK
jgi:hypothetical protein